MTYTVREAVEATRRRLYGSSRPVRNQLATTIDNSTTSVVCTYATTTIPTRALITIGLETMYVWAKDDATQTLTVQRAQSATAATAQDAGAEIEVNPRFPRPAVAQALQDVIRSWEPELFRVTDVALSSQGFPGLIDLGVDNSDAYAFLAAYYQRTSSSGTEWIDLQGSKIIRGLNTADYPSGVGFTFLTPQGGFDTPGSFRVALALPFDLDFPALSTDLVDDVGLARSMCDLAVWGAAADLLLAAEVSRTDPSAQGQARDATQVRVGDQLQVASALQRKYMDRYAKEVAKLRDRYPIRF